ncbi:LAETG motif-containing sortase-dependent surface protein [Streptomyces enissocaesilis]|uniref:Gram-positive cocci surface proteins LPxTG domain-containing protein n=1 Tax=Streptomyces enissocaesilis TaxID=332589 RepID=A0ABP6K0U0_9ACTN
MSIASRVTLWRLAGVGAATLALSTAVVASAHATGSPGGNGWDNGPQAAYKPGAGAGVKTATDRCEFSLDGQAWNASVRVDDLTLKPSDDGKVHVKVRAAADAASCTASLASYRTHGATWQTSGEQVFHDFDTVNVKGGAVDTLDIAVPDVGCFAQVDLYRGSVKYDGRTDANDGFEHGDLPVGPSRPVIKDQLIAAWNGGTKDCTKQEVPAPGTPSATPSDTPSQTPSETPAETETAPATKTPAASEPATPTEAGTAPAGETATASPSDAPSESAPANPGSDDSTGPLAETGSSNVGVTVAGAAALLAAGGGVLFAVRRRQATRSS